MKWEESCCCVVVVVVVKIREPCRFDRYGYLWVSKC